MIDNTGGISHLQKYTSFDNSTQDWVVDLENDPMPMKPRPPPANTDTNA